MNHASKLSFLLFTLLLAPLFLYPAARAHGIAPTDPSGSIPSKVMSADLWKGLSDDEKLEILDSYGYEDYSNLRLKEHFGEKQIQKALKGRKGRIFQAAFEFMVRNTDLEVNSPHATVGNPSINTLDRLTLKNGELIAFFVGIQQEGCDLPELSETSDTSSFPSTDAALAAGCEFSDVSWSSYGFFNADGSPISVDSSYHWSGY
jgi:hypothetical protein